MNASDLKASCLSYLDEARRAEQERNPLDGLLGFGRKPSDAPCHDRFVAETEAWMNAFRNASPESSAVREVLTELYQMPKKNPEPASAYWVLIAVQRLTLDLIPMLAPEDAAILAADYEETYPRRERLPAQKQVLDALKKAAKNKLNIKEKRL